MTHRSRVLLLVSGGGRCVLVDGTGRRRTASDVMKTRDRRQDERAGAQLARLADQLSNSWQLRVSRRRLDVQLAAVQLCSWLAAGMQLWCRHRR